VFSRSQVPFAFSAALVRLAVALTIGLGVGVTAGSALALGRRGAPAAVESL
jgi:hypothetical protein